MRKNVSIQHIPESAASAALINGIGIDHSLDRDPLDRVSDKEDFGRLLTRIVTLAPAPVGVGRE